MRFHSVAEGLLASPARIAVLRTLLRFPDKSWTGSALAREAGVTPRWALETLRLLEWHGLVRVERLPPVTRWSVNRKHVLVPLLSRSIELDGESRRMLQAALLEIAHAAGAKAAIWYGSTSEGTDEPGSDVDLLLVVPDRQAKARAEGAASKMAPRFFESFGNHLAFIVLTSAEFKARLNHGFVKDASRNGTWLLGRPSHG